MRAMTFDPATDRFILRDLPPPGPGPGEVLVRVLACGLNPVDAKIAQWKGLAPDMDSRWVPGLDVSGEIAALGSGVEGWKVGDRVLYHGDMLKPHGGFGDLAVHAAATLLPHPDLDPVVAAATPCAGWTAWRALHDRLQLQPGDRLLVAGGAGGVGSFAVQIAREHGLSTVIATCSARNCAHVLGLGATHALDYAAEDVVARVAEITRGRGVTKGLDTVGGDNDLLVADCLAYEGQMVELVQLVRPERYRDAFLRGLAFHQLSLGSGNRSGEEAARTLVQAGRAFSAFVEGGRIRVPVTRVVSLEEVGGALQEMLAQRTVGKIVMRHGG